MITVWNGTAKDRMADRTRQLIRAGCERVVPAGLLFWKYPQTFLPYYALDLPHKVLLCGDPVGGRLLCGRTNRPVASIFHNWLFGCTWITMRCRAPVPRTTISLHSFKYNPANFWSTAGAFDGSEHDSWLPSDNHRPPSFLRSTLSNQMR